MNRARTALVIGGGIAGPVMALALRRAGIEATVYEAYEHAADGVGGMLGLAPNGLAALDLVGAGHVIGDLGQPVASMMIQSWTGKRLAEFGGGDGVPVFHAIWRADLYRALYDEARARGIAIEHGKRLVNAVDHGDGVTAEFADGTRASADLLIGADGIRSTVRSLIDPAAPGARYSGLLGFGARPDRPAGLPDTGGSMYMVYGKRAFFAYFVDPDGRAGWFVNLPRQVPMTAAEAKAVGAREWLRLLEEVFAGDRVPAVRLLRQCEPDELVITGALEDLPRVPVWSRGRMVLVGDAAHAASPTSGQGASLAVESAVQLARCLRDAPGHPAAFAAYEALRRERVERVIAAAARGNQQKAAGPVARVVRDLLLPPAMKLLSKPEKMAWQVDYRIDWEAPVEATPAA
ncbi:NAD(P)/FAD-dependent oxidoreductase [Amycolatopsis cynarae]|uniref:NAD(P)/FAD-dependent oxidoreductase n=1 Tax=Amycolatopsis cynarae TaxID=2995223 RepID=A0ABY7AWC1_9PSEU|nr:NAD(P)/FAD-dependent oxidoreductase [Amycolatopsis sp. HUAS 11-8]WAL64305.1 NAD(P)/FAD-dependent oxidoreductase [Amycolatopsis sp. HUAS 11-8]